MIQKMWNDPNVTGFDLDKMVAELRKSMKEEVEKSIYNAIIGVAEKRFKRKINAKSKFDAFVEALKNFKKLDSKLATDTITIPKFGLNSLHTASWGIKFSHAVLMAERVWIRGYITKDALKDIFAVNEVGVSEFNVMMENWKDY